MVDEHTTLKNVVIWSLVDPDPSQNLVGCKWLFRIKHNPDGTIEIFKYILVAIGFHQKEGLEYKNTFSPVAKPITIRVILSLVVLYRWDISQLDVTNSFLHEELHVEVYMVQTPGFVGSENPHHVCELHKAIYGLKKAPRDWYIWKVTKILLSYGFMSSKDDTSLFIQKHGTRITLVLVYVDDILITGNDKAYVMKLSQIWEYIFQKELYISS